MHLIKISTKRCHEFQRQQEGACKDDRKGRNVIKSQKFKKKFKDV